MNGYWKWHLFDDGAEVPQVDLLALGGLVLLVAEQPHVEVHGLLPGQVRSGEIRGNTGRSVEIQGVLGRSAEIRGDQRRSGEIRGDTGRSGEIRSCAADLLALGGLVLLVAEQPHVATASCRKVDIRLPGRGNSNSHGARPVHLIISMIKWIRTSCLTITNSLTCLGVRFRAKRKQLAWF